MTEKEILSEIYWSLLVLEQRDVLIYFTTNYILKEITILNWKNHLQQRT